MRDQVRTYSHQPLFKGVMGLALILLLTSPSALRADGWGQGSGGYTGNGSGNQNNQGRGNGGNGGGNHAMGDTTELYDHLSRQRDQAKKEFEAAEALDSECRDEKASVKAKMKLIGSLSDNCDCLTPFRYECKWEAKSDVFYDTLVKAGFKGRFTTVKGDQRNQEIEKFLEDETSRKAAVGVCDAIISLDNSDQFGSMCESELNKRLENCQSKIANDVHEKCKDSASNLTRKRDAFDAASKDLQDFKTRGVCINCNEPRAKSGLEMGLEFGKLIGGTWLGLKQIGQYDNYIDQCTNACISAQVPCHCAPPGLGGACGGQATGWGPTQGFGMGSWPGGQGAPPGYSPWCPPGGGYPPGGMPPFGGGYGGGPYGGGGPGYGGGYGGGYGQGGQGGYGGGGYGGGYGQGGGWGQSPGVPGWGSGGWNLPSWLGGLTGGASWGNPSFQGAQSGYYQGYQQGAMSAPPYGYPQGGNGLSFGW